MLVRFSLKKPRSLVIYTRPTNELLTTFQPASQLTKTKSRAHIETSWKEAGRVRGPEGERSRRNSAKEPEKFGPEGAKTKTRLHRSRRPTYQRIAERQKERERGREKDWTENQQKGEKNRENGGRRKERGNEKEGRCRYYGGPRESRNADTHTHTHIHTHTDRSPTREREGEAEGAGGWGKTDPPWATFPRSHEWTRVATRHVVGRLLSFLTPASTSSLVNRQHRPRYLGCPLRGSLSTGGKTETWTQRGRGNIFVDLRPGVRNSGSSSRKDTTRRSFEEIRANFLIFYKWIFLPSHWQKNYGWSPFEIVIERIGTDNRSK